MIKVIKRQGQKVRAYRLGEENPTLRTMMAEGKIRQIGDRYEVFSREAVNGKGESAAAGDYVKVDSGGYPYPNDAAHFERSHKKIGDDLYEQIPAPLDAWTVQEPFGEEIGFLIRKKGLVLRPDDPERYFNAELWGAPLSAPKDAVVVFYSISRDGSGRVTDAEFNFVDRAEFDRTYRIL